MNKRYKPWIHIAFSCLGIAFFQKVVSPSYCGSLWTLLQESLQPLPHRCVLWWLFLLQTLLVQTRSWKRANEDVLSEPAEFRHYAEEHEMHSSEQKQKTGLSAPESPTASFPLGCQKKKTSPSTFPGCWGTYLCIYLCQHTVHTYPAGDRVMAMQNSHSYSIQTEDIV